MSNPSKNITANSIGNATFWSFAAEIAAKIIVPITNMILARILAPEAFGIIATISMVISLADTMSTAGFQKFVIQHEYDNKEDLFKGASVAFWTNVSIAFFAWLIIFLFRNPISDAVGNSGYGVALAVSALILPLTALSSIQEALFQRDLNYRVLFIRRLLVSILPLVVTVPLALLGLKHWSIIIGNIAGGILRAVLLTCMSEWKPKFFFRWKILKEMFSFGAWTLLESIAMWASSYIDILIISNKLGSYYTGLYKNSQSTVTGILTIITSATTSVLFASLSRYQNDEKEFQNIFYSFQKNVALFVIPLGVGIFCYSDLVTRIILGEKWMEASFFVGIWGLCTSFVCVFGTFSRELYRAKGKPKISLFAQVFHLIFLIPVCFIFVNRGFRELAYARSFAYLQIIVVHMIFVKFTFKLSPFKMFWSVKEPILCSAIMGAVAILFKSFINNNYFLQFASVFVCMIVYFALLFIFPEYRKFLLERYVSIKDKMLSVVKRG